MRIINTNRKLLSGSIKLLLPVILCLLAGFFYGCGDQKTDLAKAESFDQQATVYYQKAVNIYKRLISHGKNLDDLHYKLGLLHYQYGDFKRAIDELKKTSNPGARKFLGISYYRDGDFTEARHIFDKNNISDDESLYYYGLTSEKLNLFDQALEIYKRIKNRHFASLAKARLDLIEIESGKARIMQLDPEIHRIIASSPAPQEYPQAGALILLSDEKIEVMGENSQVSYLHYLIKIINERGKEKFSETVIDYDSTFEKIELEFARVIKPDGSVVNVGTRHIRDVSKYLNFPLYSNARVFIISFPEISEGAVIEYKARIIRNKLIKGKDFSFCYTVQTDEPVIKADFMIKLPADNKLFIKKINTGYNNFGADLDPSRSRDSLGSVYRWQFNRIPQIIPESNMPAVVEVNPAVVISTFRDWQEIYEWWYSLAKDKISADQAIKSKVKELVKGKSSEADKIKAIYNFCAQKIRYVAVEYGQAGYEPHAAGDVFRNKYGDCKDKAVLLVTMLKEAGFDARPVLISTRDYFDLIADFPAMIFNHAIAAVNLKGKTVFMDATAETCSFDDLPSADQGRKVFAVDESGFSILTTPLYPARHNSINQNLVIRIGNDESISCEKTVWTSGIYDQSQRYWLLYTPPELIEESLRQKIQDTSIGAKLSFYEISNVDDLNKPVVLKYSFTGPEYLTLAGDLRIMPQLAWLDASIAAKDKRKYPLDFGFLDSKEILLEVAVPPDSIVRYIPQSFVEESPWIKFSVDYALKGNKIYFKQNTELKKRTIEQAEYPDFKAFFGGLAKRVKQRVILEKRQAK